MFVHNFDSLVTKDYLDARFSEQSVRLDSMDVKFDTKLGLLSAEIDGKLGKLYVMFGVIMVGLAVPVIQTLITWLA